MRIQWCPECHWESQPLTFGLGGVFGQLDGLLGPMGQAERKRACPECGYWIVLEVTKAAA